MPYTKTERPEDLNIDLLFESVEAFEAEQERYLRFMIGDKLYEWLSKNTQDSE